MLRSSSFFVVHEQFQKMVMADFETTCLRSFGYKIHILLILKRVLYINTQLQILNYK